MTLTRFVTKSAFRNKRRSFLTVLSITFSLVLLTLMMTVWHSWYIDKGSTESAQRLITRHRVSLTQSLPEYYREKMRTVPGVVAVAPTQWFGGLRSEEHTSELQSRQYLVCRLLLEKKKKKSIKTRRVQ